jgi:Leucine-rich repeat (LRR) protein
MMSSTTSPSKKEKSTVSQYERKLARQRQLELMEAAASGIAPPSMSLDFVEDGYSAVTSAGSGAASSTNIHRRSGVGSKMFDDTSEEVLTFHTSPTRGSKPTTSSLFNTITLSPTRSSNTKSKNLFDQRGRPGGNDAFPSGLNLMDHSTGVYKELTTSERIINNLRSMFSIGGKHSNKSSTMYPEMFDAGMAHQDDFNGGDYVGHSRSSSMKRRNTYMARLWGDKRRRNMLFLLIGLAILIITLIVLTTVTYNYTTEQKLRRENTKRFNNIMDHIIENGVSNPQKVMNYHTPEHHALRWVAYSDPASLPIDDPMLVVRYALATLFYSSYLKFETLAGRQQPIEIGDKQWEGVPNPGWTRKDFWMSEKGVCAWYGVHCPYQMIPNSKTGILENVTQYDMNAQPISLVIRNNHMVGSIVPEVKVLNELQTLDLSNNKIDGTLPHTLGTMYNLETLHLSNNNITGNLYHDFSAMERIQDIDLHNNQISGPIPNQVNHLYELQTLNLGNNNMSGTVPDLKDCKKLKSLHLEHNRFFGDFPFTLALQVSLTDLYLNNNHFRGTIPAEIESIRGIERLRLEFNKIGGHIPRRMFAKMSNLREVSFENNVFTGTIPSDMSAMSQLEILHLGTNKFNGTIPSVIGTLPILDQIHLNNNVLTGTIPTTLGHLGALNELWLQNNKLKGSIPTQLGNCHDLETFFVENNQLTGTIPTSVASMKSIKSFRTHFNSLEGDVPTEICALKETHLKFLTSDCKGKVQCPKGCCNECY